VTTISTTASLLPIKKYSYTVLLLEAYNAHVIGHAWSRIDAELTPAADRLPSLLMVDFFAERRHYRHLLPGDGY